MNTVRVRFAPSPTGHLHIGGLRAALFNWLFARHNKGVFLIRIEDTDRERSKPEYVQSFLDSFTWTGITPDEPIVIQSERLAEHKKVIDQLLKQKKAYKCYCSAQEVVDRVGGSSATDGEELFIRYDGRCRELSDQPNKPYAVRYKLPTEVQRVVFEDLIRGTVTFERDQLDDFIIARSDGWPIYNFVVVVDDAFMRITHVIRGEEHLSNTPKQILLAQACGYAIPQFAHLPIILNQDGKKMSKRDGAVSVIEYKRDGYLPDALINYLVRLGWSHGDQEVFTLDELIQYFSLDAVGKKGAIFDMQKLNWLNGVYIKTRSSQDLLAYISKELEPGFRGQFSRWTDDELKKAIDLYKERVVTIRELMDEIMLLYIGPRNYDAPEIRSEANNHQVEILDHLLKVLQNQDNFGHDSLAVSIKSLSKTMGVKLMQLAHPIRVALLGKSNGPGVFELLALVGKSAALERVNSYQRAIKGFIGATLD